jgi:acetoin utilization deacetylase AcuC-like enzyme
MCCNSWFNARYLKDAYSKWVSDGGNPAGVFPDTFPVRFDPSSTPTGNGRPGYHSFDLTAIVAEGTYQAAYEAAQVALTAAEILVSIGMNATFALCRYAIH